jgi:hypothetical protein
MEALVWVGTAVSLTGLAGIVACVVHVLRARRRASADDAALREAVRRVLPWNLGAFFLSMAGLMLVIVGVILA